MSEHTITVAVDPKLHIREPGSESERLVWAALDTAWNLLREYAVRVTIQDIREANPDSGFPATDQELFDSAHPLGGPANHLELAPELGDSPQVNLAVMGLAEAFDAVCSQARSDAALGLGLREA